jgi:hypothetical protein
MGTCCHKESNDYLERQRQAKTAFSKSLNKKKVISQKREIKLYMYLSTYISVKDLTRIVYEYAEEVYDYQKYTVNFKTPSVDQKWLTACGVNKNHLILTQHYTDGSCIYALNLKTFQWNTLEKVKDSGIWPARESVVEFHPQHSNYMYVRYKGSAACIVVYNLQTYKIIMKYKVNSDFLVLDHKIANVVTENNDGYAQRQRQMYKGDKGDKEDKEDKEDIKHNRYETSFIVGPIDRIGLLKEFVRFSSISGTTYKSTLVKLRNNIMSFMLTHVCWDVIDSNKMYLLTLGYSLTNYHPLEKYAYILSHLDIKTGETTELMTFNPPIGNRVCWMVQTKFGSLLLGDNKFIYMYNEKTNKMDTLMSPTYQESKYPLYAHSPIYSSYHNAIFTLQEKQDLYFLWSKTKLFV